MQIGNRESLDSARDALRDQFDAVWLAAPKAGLREVRAMRCAMKLDHARTHSANGCNWIIFEGGRATLWGALPAEGARS